MNYSQLKNAIAEVIRTNGNEEITGEVLQYTLLEMVSVLGKDYQFAGVGTPLTDTTERDDNVAWILGRGTYENFGNPFTVAVDEIAVVKYDGTFTVEKIKTGVVVDSELTLEGTNPVEGGAIAREFAKMRAAGYFFAGIMTPTGTPPHEITEKIFYLCTQAGVYPNFDSIVLDRGLNILKWNGSRWSADLVFAITDDVTEGLASLLTSAGAYAAIAAEAQLRQDGDAAVQQNIDAVEALIPSQASVDNKLVDEQKMNSSIATATATYRGAYNQVSNLNLGVDATYEQVALALASQMTYLHITPDNNDYCYVLVPTSAEIPTEIAHIDRYKYNGTAWGYEYTLNNSGYTAAQWAAINSGITSGLVAKLGALPTAQELAAALLTKQDVLTFDNAPTPSSTNPVTSGGVYTAIDDEKGARINADAALQQAIEAILLLIPSAATALNQLADKDFVNSSIATATATFRGTFNLVSDLQLTVDATHADIAAALLNAISTADNNDYAFVQIPTSVDTPTEIRVTERYKFNGTAWQYEYDLNNSGFTAAQWAAINSGITTLLVTKLSNLPNATELAALFAGKQNVLTFDDSPVSGSDNPVKSGGLYNLFAAIDAKMPTGASANNKLVAEDRLAAYVGGIIGALDATFDLTSTDGHVTLRMTQTDGVITSLQILTSDIASASALTTLGGQVSTNADDIAALQALYNALQQSAPQVIEPSDTWPVASPSDTVIYRVIDRVNTPPQYYSDYMWNGTAMVLMATYNNAIDAVPTAGSHNLVESGGVKLEIDKNVGYTLTGTASSWAFFYEFAPELPIGSTVVNHGPNYISLYDSAKSESLDVPPGFEVTTDKAYKYIRNTDGINEYNVEIKGSIDVELSNTQKAIEKEVTIIRASIELNKYIDYYTGKIVYNNGTAVSKPIELRNGNGFNVKCEIAPTLYFFYTDNPYNSNTFISVNNTGLIPNNAKYVVFYWNGTAVSTEGFAAQDIQLTDINLINSQLAGSYHKFREDAITVMSDAILNLYYTQTCAVKELYIKDASLKNDNLRLSIENTTTNKRIIVNGDSTSLVVYNVPEESSEGIYTLENDLLYIVVDMSMMSGLSTSITDANALRLTLASFTKIESEQPTPTEEKITTDELEVLDWSDKYTVTNKAIWRSTTSDHMGGAEFSDSGRDATPYLDLDGVVEVFMKLPEIGTGAGAAWYNAEKVCLENIDSSNEIDNSKSELWLTVPYGARYLRASINKTDSPYILKVRAKKQIPVITAARESYLLNPMAMPLTSRVFATYSDFVDGNNEPIATSRVPLNVVSGGNGEQIKLSFNNRLLRHTALASVKVNSASSVITWGNSDEPLSNADNYIITVEARFYNEGGVGKLFVVKKNSDGTDAVIATTKTLAFTVAAGNTYHIGYRKVEFDTPDENDKAYGYGEFFVKFGSVEETQRFLYKTSVIYPEGAQEGDPTVRSDSLAGLCGKPYFGIKSGDVVYTNFYISTDYDPQVKGMIIGDSFIGANTLCEDGNIHKKYATLLQNDLGKDSFMVIGKGGEAVDSIVNQFAPYDVAAFKPTYLIIALGVNNHSFDEYLGALNQLLDMLKSRHVEPILTTITPIRPSSTTTNEDVLQAINAWVRNSGYRYVDIFNAVAETTNGVSVWKEGMSLPDGIHPSLAGHEAIYNAFVLELPEIFAV